jgi:hypothetical protein
VSPSPGRGRHVTTGYSLDALRCLLVVFSLSPCAAAGRPASHLASARASPRRPRCSWRSQTPTWTGPGACPGRGPHGRGSLVHGDGMKRGRRRGRERARHGRAVEHESTRSGHGYRPWAATAARPGPVSSVECDGGALLLSPVGRTA